MENTIQTVYTSSTGNCISNINFIELVNHFQLIPATQSLSHYQHEHDYINISYSTLKHIISHKALTSQEKLIYIISDLYGAKTLSSSISKGRCVKFTAKKFSEIIGCSIRTILRTEQKLEQFGYFHIKRSKNHKNRNNVNIITPTVPNNVFRELSAINIRNNPDFSNIAITSTSDLKKLIDIDLNYICKRTILDKIGQYISFNFSIIKRVIFSNDLTSLEKIRFIDLYINMHLLSTKRCRIGYYGYFEYDNLEQRLAISRTRLSKLLNKFSKLGFITKEQFFVQSKDNVENITDSRLSTIQSNRFDKSIWRITITMPIDLKLSKTENTEDLSKTCINESSLGVPLNNILTKRIDNYCKGACASSVTMDVRAMSPIIKRNKIRRIDKKETIAKSDKSLSIIYNNFDKNNNAVVRTYNKNKHLTCGNNHQILAQKKKESRFVETSSGNGKINSKTLEKSTESVKTKQNNPNYSNFDKPKKLSDFFPINKDDRDTLTAKSGKDVSIDFMNDILRSMASKMEKLDKEPTFEHKGKFLKYFSIALKHELRDEDKEIESYFCKIEDDAIYKRTDLRQLKAKLINTLPKDIAYPLVKNMIYTNLDYLKKDYVTSHNRSYADTEGVSNNSLNSITPDSAPCTVHLTKDISDNISDYYKDRILNDIRATYGANVPDVKFKTKSDKEKQIYKQQHRTQENAKQNENTEKKDMNADFTNCDIWTKIVNCLAKNHDVDTSHIHGMTNANIDEVNKTIVVTTDTETSKELVKTRYLNTLNKIIESYGYKLLRFNTKHYESIPDGTWGGIRKYLINEYNEYFDKHCFSKLIPSIDETNKAITFKSDKEQNEIIQRFKDVIANACSSKGYKIL